MKRVLAFDLGASSGRAMLASLDEAGLSLQEVHRFENIPQRIDGTLYWAVDRLFEEIGLGVRKAWAQGGFDSLAFDTWGVDFGLVGPEGLLECPVCYRDNRTAGRAAQVNLRLGAAYLYDRNGLQQLDHNTVYQLDFIRERCPELLEKTESMLLMPDLFSWMLTGERVAELTEASTTGLLDPAVKEWDWQLIQTMGLPTRIFPRIVQPGERIGCLRPELCRAWGVPAVPVIAVASHDTASAVAAIPDADEGICFLSCGTWSLLGTKLSAPVIGPDSRACGLTNEVGYGGETTFLKNIIGLWLIQETRRQFRREGKEYSYAEMEHLARETPAFTYFIDPDAPEFLPPGDIPGKIREFCRRTGQEIPATDGAVIRCIYESLALKYRYALDQLRRCTGRQFTGLRVVGGGVKDGFLCQMAANATGLPVLTGPVEATALGNAAVQLIGLRAVPDLEAAHVWIKGMDTSVRYDPTEMSAWEDVYHRFKRYIIGEKEEQKT